MQEAGSRFLDQINDQNKNFQFLVAHINNSIDKKFGWLKTILEQLKAQDLLGQFHITTI